MLPSVEIYFDSDWDNGDIRLCRIMLICCHKNVCLYRFHCLCFFCFGEEVVLFLEQVMTLFYVLFICGCNWGTLGSSKGTRGGSNFFSLVGTLALPYLKLVRMYTIYSNFKFIIHIIPFSTLIRFLLDAPKRWFVPRCCPMFPLPIFCCFRTLG